MKKKASHSTLSNVWYILKLQWKYGRSSFLIMIIEIIVSLGLSMITLFIPKIVLGEVLSDHSLNRIMLTIAGFCGILAVLNLINNIVYTYKNVVTSKYHAELMVLKNTKSVYTDYENIESAKVRLLLDQASKILWNSGGSSKITDMSSNIANLFINTVGFLLSGTIISFASPWISALLALTAFIHYFFVRALQNYQHSRREETSELGRKLWYIAAQSVSFDSIKDIHLYGMNTWLIEMYKSLTNQHLKIDAAIARKSFIPDIVDALIILLRDGFVYLFLIVMVVEGKITVDNFVLYFAAVGTFAGKIGRVFVNFNVIRETSLSVCDFRDYLNYPEKSNRGKGCMIPNQNQTCEIELKNVSYRYEGNDTDTLSDISIKINAGEKIAIVGLNGAGKTTLIKNICGLYIPTSGIITVNNHETSEYNQFDYYTMFAVVFQDFHLLPVSIAQIISGKTEEETDRKRVTECIRLAGLENKIESLEFGIDTKLNKQINENAIELSGGEKQKLLIARAIYKNAPILILDEPTAALDPIAENELYQKYNEITKNKT